jgi:uncharacterized protein
MPKLKLLDIKNVVAIDIHTHAEEPCGLHGDDGYDDFQEKMAEYFKSPNKHPPTVPETDAYYRAKNIVAVIFPAERERPQASRRAQCQGDLTTFNEWLKVHESRPRFPVMPTESGTMRLPTHVTSLDRS